MSFNMKKSMMGAPVINARLELLDAMLNSPIPKEELLRNLGVYLLPLDLKRFLFFDSLYRQLLTTPGIVCEFGCRWGQNLAVLQSLRALYEPFNPFRTIVGFDTFGGLHGVTEKDGSADYVAEGAFGVSQNYEEHLERVLDLKQTASPLLRTKDFQVIKGDAPEKFREYLEAHPETIVSFAYFDMDIYEPTVKCLQLLKKHLTKGSIVGFDELNFPDYPGETLAFQEAIGANNVRLQRNQWSGGETFFVVE